MPYLICMQGGTCGVTKAPGDEAAQLSTGVISACLHYGYGNRRTTRLTIAATPFMAFQAIILFTCSLLRHHSWLTAIKEGAVFVQ